MAYYGHKNSKFHKYGKWFNVGYGGNQEHNCISLMTIILIDTLYITIYTSLPNLIQKKSVCRNGQEQKPKIIQKVRVLKHSCEHLQIKTSTWLKQPLPSPEAHTAL